MKKSVLVQGIVRMGGFLLAPHPSERTRGLHFQEEARTERLSNLIRGSFTVIWLVTAASYAPDNLPAFNRINLGIGLGWLVLGILYQAWLCVRPYRSFLKYLSTTLDMLVATGILMAYAIVAGPSFVLKMPIYLNYLCFFGLAAIRFRGALALYAAGLAVGLILFFWLWLDTWYGIDYGNRMSHAVGGKVSASYLIDILLYLGILGSLTMMAVLNIRRQVELRTVEVERAVREEELALMAAGLAHEIRNPLTGIYGAAQLLRDEGRGDTRLTGIILTDVRRMQAVVESFLQYSRPFPARSEDVDLVALGQDFCREQSGLFPAVPLGFSCSEIPPIVRTDPVALRQILLNLAQNARRYQQPGRTVRVRLLSRGGVTNFRVEDDGAGVPPELRPHLFEPFRTQSPGGTGLGLAMSRKIARELGGDLLFEPLHPGACFILVASQQPGSR